MAQARGISNTAINNTPDAKVPASTDHLAPSQDNFLSLKYYLTPSEYQLLCLLDLSLKENEAEVEGGTLNLIGAPPLKPKRKRRTQISSEAETIIPLQKTAARQLSVDFSGNGNRGFKQDDSAPQDIWEAARLRRKAGDDETKRMLAARPKSYSESAYWGLWLRTYGRRRTIKSSLIWFTGIRLIILRFHRIFEYAVGYFDKTLKYLTRVGGLSYAADLFFALGLAGREAWKNWEGISGSNHFFSLFWKYLTQDNNHRFLINAVVWLVPNAVLFFLSGGMQPIVEGIIGLIPFIADVFVDGYKGWRGGQAEYEQLLKKVNERLIPAYHQQTISDVERAQLELARIKIKDKIKEAKSERYRCILMTMLILIGMIPILFTMISPPGWVMLAGAITAFLFGSIVYGLGKRTFRKVSDLRSKPDDEIDLEYIAEQLEQTPTPIPQPNHNLEHRPLLAGECNNAVAAGSVVDTADVPGLKPDTAMNGSNAPLQSSHTLLTGEHSSAVASSVMDTADVVPGACPIPNTGINNRSNALTCSLTTIPENSLSSSVPPVINVPDNNKAVLQVCASSDTNDLSTQAGGSDGGDLRRVNSAPFTPHTPSPLHRPGVALPSPLAQVQSVASSSPPPDLRKVHEGSSTSVINSALPQQSRDNDLLPPSTASTVTSTTPAKVSEVTAQNRARSDWLVSSSTDVRCRTQEQQPPTEVVTATAPTMSITSTAT